MFCVFSNQLFYFEPGFESLVAKSGRSMSDVYAPLMVDSVEGTYFSRS